MARREQVMQLYVLLHADVATRGEAKSSNYGVSNQAIDGRIHECGNKRNGQSSNKVIQAERF